MTRLVTLVIALLLSLLSITLRMPNELFLGAPF